MRQVKIRGEVYDADPGKIRFSEAKAIENVTGLTYTQWDALLAAGSATAAQALVWVLMRRTNPDLRFDDVEDLAMDDIEFTTIPDPGEKKPRPSGGRGVDPTRKASEPPARTSS